jgi:hypothetical protein
MAASVVVLKSGSGIKRDGTVFEGDFYVDGYAFSVVCRERFGAIAQSLCTHLKSLEDLAPSCSNSLSTRTRALLVTSTDLQ